MSYSQIKFNERITTINSYLKEISKVEYIGLFYKNIEDPKKFKFTEEKYLNADYLLQDNRSSQKLLKYISNPGESQMYFLGVSKDESNEDKKSTLKWYS